jgi:hypothetical protein
MYLSNLNKIYDSYSQKGVMQEIRRAYLFFKSCELYGKDSITDENFFRHLEGGINEVSNVEEVCKISYLYLCRELPELSYERQKKCSDLILELVNKKIRLPFFKDFRKWFEIPNSLIDKYIVEYKGNPANDIFIDYILETGNFQEKKYLREPLKQVCPGVFTKEFILFYGENVFYYITEKNEDEEIITESVKYSPGDHVCTDESRYGQLNNMMIALVMKDEKTFRDMAKNYFMESDLADRVLDIV